MNQGQPSNGPRNGATPILVWLGLVCLLIVAMVAVGGITRLTGSGLSMVDWKPILGTVPPVNEAQWTARFEQYQAFPQYNLHNPDMTLDEFKVIFGWEYAHRILGRLIGVAFLLPYLYFLLRRRLRRGMAVKLGIAFLLGGAQGLLGWYMVQSGLVDVPQVSHLRLAAHLALAFALFAYLVWLGLDLLPRRGGRLGEQRSRALVVTAVLFLVLLAAQILYGGFMAGLKAGFVFNTFPKMLGFWIPPGLLALEPAVSNLFSNPTMVQFVHRGLGFLLVGVACSLVPAALSSKLTDGQRMAAFGIFGMTILQFLLGVTTLLLKVPLALAAMHQVTACVLLGFAVALVHEAIHGLRPSHNLLGPATTKTHRFQVSGVRFQENV